MKKQSILLLIIVIIAFTLRIYGIDWDKGFHLHPDERMIIIVADRINFFNQLNPNFFNYGSLTIYILKGSSQMLEKLLKIPFANYQNMLYVGRVLSLLLDILITILIFESANLLFKEKKIAFFSAFFYAVSFFPIQNSHFFISDVFLNFYTTAFVYSNIKYLTYVNQIKTKNFKNKYPILIGITFAAMMTTKISASIFYPIILFSLLITTYLLNKKLKKPLKIFLKNIFINFFLFHLTFFIFAFLFMPYAFLDYKKFISDIKLQLEMNSNPYIFPYTLQYVDTPSYWYYLKNIFLWGLGPVISILFFLGFFIFLNNLKNEIKNKKTDFKYFQPVFFYLLTYLIYFFIIGRSAVKFMRYLLPMYPFFIIFAGYGFYQLTQLKIFRQYSFFKKIFLSLIIIVLTIWAIMFVNIYSYPHTRIAATEWILKNIPPGSTLGVEHWDDRLPLYGAEKYNFNELTLYDQPDDEVKWSILEEKLKKTNYLIIASNRLYIPLQRLKDCSKYKVCYPKTAFYYQKLFKEELGFKKIAEFVVYPSLKIFGLELKINDQSADESFTVYDHPKVMIFKKIIK